MAVSQGYPHKRFPEAAFRTVALHGAAYSLLPGHHANARRTRIARCHDNDHTAPTKTSSSTKDPLEGDTTTKRSVRPAARRRYADDLWHACASGSPVRNVYASGNESHAFSCVAERWVGRYVSSRPRFRKKRQTKRLLRAGHLSKAWTPGDRPVRATGRDGTTTRGGPREDFS